jgi:hypothetical protein
LTPTALLDTPSRGFGISRSRLSLIGDAVAVLCCVLCRRARVQMAELREEMGVLRGDLEDLNDQEVLLDDYIKKMSEMLKELTEQSENAQLAFITHNDIRTLPQYDGDTLIAIKAPPGTTLEVPDAEDAGDARRKQQVFLRSNTGPIEIFLVSQPDANSDEQAAATAAATPGAAVEGDNKLNVGEKDDNIRMQASSPALSALSAVAAAASNATLANAHAPDMMQSTSTSDAARRSASATGGPASSPSAASGLVKIDTGGEMSDFFFNSMEGADAIGDIYNPDDNILT